MRQVYRELEKCTLGVLRYMMSTWCVIMHELLDFNYNSMLHF